MSTTAEQVPSEVPAADRSALLAPAPVQSGLDRRTVLRGLGIAVVILIVGLFVPDVISDETNMGIATDGVVLGILALSIGFLAHRSGLISLGHTAFYGASAYGLAIATTQWDWSPMQAIVFAVLGGTVLGLVIGAFVVRTPGVSFLVLTLAIGQALHQLVVQDSVRGTTGAYDGLAVTWGADDKVAGLGQSEIGNAASFWPLAWVSLVVVLVILWLVGRSRFGRVLEAIRENEERARFSGFNTYVPRLIAFTLSSAIASLAGALFALKASFVSPDTLSFVTAGDSLIAAIVGGFATLVGPLVGGVLYIYAQSELSDSGNLQLFTGIALVVAVVFLRGGVVGFVTDTGRKVRARVATTRKGAGR
ncbi:branched-chain amino acid ABC transporter permease [Patulibacter sp. NPDC049589]|uniref:branched-chain amino acid ABC transporter permease n=1 Tax=Patulibacter sp. NPDC049589 TaxID=3154731 RepID=UPI003432BB9F